MGQPTISLLQNLWLLLDFALGWTKIELKIGVSHVYCALALSTEDPDHVDQSGS